MAPLYRLFREKLPKRNSKRAARFGFLLLLGGLCACRIIPCDGVFGGMPCALAEAADASPAEDAPDFADENAAVPDGSADAVLSVTDGEAPILRSEPAELTLFGGGSDQLDILLGDAEQPGFTFVSSDPETALADAHGVVVALKKGSCTVTATDKADASRVVTIPVTVTRDRPTPALPKSLAGLCYRQKVKCSVAERKAIETYVFALRDRAEQGEATPGEQIVLAALGYLGHEYGSKQYGRVDCSMLLFLAGFDTGRTLPRRSDWQAEFLEDYAVDTAHIEPGDYLFLASYEGENCRCDGACTRYQRIHHAAVYLGKINGEHWVVEASSRVGKVVIRRWTGENSHAGYELKLIARPAEVKAS